MEFKKHMPDNYYQTKIIDNFTDFNLVSINYNNEIYQRNPEVINKLSLNHIEVIEFFVRLLKPRSFLELGTQYGECTNQLLPLVPELYIGVDMKKTNNIDYLLGKYKHFQFYNMTTDEYFQNIKNKLDNGKKIDSLDSLDYFDMVFIDACHTHEATYRDFLNVIDYVNEDGYIFFHDCYPYSKHWTNPELCGDAYKTSEIIRKYHNNQFEILTIPVNPGLSIARKCTKQLKWL
jgi:predicted O-methyltransferase YrrM